MYIVIIVLVQQFNDHGFISFKVCALLQALKVSLHGLGYVYINKWCGVKREQIYRVWNTYVLVLRTQCSPLHAFWRVLFHTC